MAPHSSTLAWKIPWMEEPGGLQSMGSLRVGHDSDFTFTFHFHALEKEMATHSIVLAWRNSMDRGAWRATVHGIRESQTRLSDVHFQAFYRNIALNITHTYNEISNIL